MSSGTCTIFGFAVIALLLAGYLGQRYLPPPKPKLIGIDLGTTYSCVGVYHAVSGKVNVLADSEEHLCIPSIVSYRHRDDVVVGYKAAAEAEHNSANTIYDAKRFIGKQFSGEELKTEALRYPFKIQLNNQSYVEFVVHDRSSDFLVSSEDVGAKILKTLKHTAETRLRSGVTAAVMTVPAEFNQKQRNATRRAAQLAGIDVWRIINEPTAAALAYGLHTKEGVSNVLVVDLGGGTLDVSLLNIQGGMFLTMAMAGNNHLGGQDFNERLKSYIMTEIEKEFGRTLTDLDDLQQLRHTVEALKLRLTQNLTAPFVLNIRSFSRTNHRGGQRTTFKRTITRSLFEDLNSDLFKKVLEPIDRVLESVQLGSSDIDEVVLVGGSTRIPKVRQIITEYFGKEPNVSIDPELAVVTGVSIQAGIIGGAWPLVVSAIEVPTTAKKIFLH